MYSPSTGKVSLVDRLVTVVRRRILLQHLQLILLHGVTDDWATVRGGGGGGGGCFCGDRFLCFGCGSCR